MRSSAVGFGTLGLLALPASAADEAAPATLPLFPDLQCMTVVDRSVDPVFHFEYELPMEDTDVADVEVEGSRTYQFFALARQRGLDRLPGWISEADVMQAQQKERAGMGAIEPDDVLETSTLWSEADLLPITGSDERRPITAAAAEPGVDWDTSGAPAGTYLVAAYAWKPPQNAWQERWEAVRVVDDPEDRDAAPPTFFFGDARGGSVVEGQTVELSACAAAMDGATYTVEWGINEGLGIDVWEPAVQDEPLDNGPLVVSLVGPPVDAPTGIVVRARIEDPSGRSYVAYRAQLLTVLPDPDQEPDSSGTGAGSEGEGDSNDASGGGGCRIPAGGEAPHGAGWWAALWIVFQRPWRRP